LITTRRRRDGARFRQAVELELYRGLAKITSNVGQDLTLPGAVFIVALEA